MTQDIKKLSAPNNLWLFAVIYSVLITILLLVPSSGVPRINIPYFDKVVHIVIFLLLSLLWLRAIFAKITLSSKQLLLFFGIIVAYGIIIEIIQGLFIESRQADFWDVLANSLGMTLGWFVFLKTRELFKSKS